MSFEEPTAGNGPNREKLEGALDAIFEVLGSERLDEVRDLVTDVDHRLSGRITSVSEQSTSANEVLKDGLTNRIDEAFGKLDQATAKLDELFGKLDRLSRRLDELDERQKSAAGALEKQIGDATADWSRHLEESKSVAEDRIRAVKDELGTSLASKEEHINKELDTLARNMSGIQLEFGQHARATERMSIVLDGLANVLKTDSPPAPSTEDRLTPGAAAIEPSPIPPEDVNEEILDNALERVFSPKNPS